MTTDLIIGPRDPNQKTLLCRHPLNQKFWYFLLEGIAKLASREKFSDFFAGSIFCKAPYPAGHRHFAKNRIQRKKRKFGFEWQFAIPSLTIATNHFLFATVNEPLRWEFLSGYRNDRLHWHLQTGGTGLLTTSEIWRDVQFWENGLTIQTIHRDLVLNLRGSYAAFGKGGTVFERYANLPMTPDEPQFQFNTSGWAADAAGYFGYAVNLTTDRTYKVILVPLIGYSAHFERLRGRDGDNLLESTNAIGGGLYAMHSSLPGFLHLTWYGMFLGGAFQIDPGGKLHVYGGYSYHWLHARFKANYKYTVSLFNPEFSSEQENSFSLQTKKSGNLGQTGWAELDYLISSCWRTGIGAQIHYYSSDLLDTQLKQQSTVLIPVSSSSTSTSQISQKLKIRWTSVSGWFMISKQF